MTQLSGDKMRGKNLRIALTNLSGLINVLLGHLGVEFWVFCFRFPSSIQSLGGKTRGKNLHITLKSLSGFTAIETEALIG